MQPVTAKRFVRAGGGGCGKKTRVLLADDHPVIRDGLRNAIEGEPDLEVVGQAADGAEAVRLAQKLRPDVVVMDMFMPRMDGLMATERLRVLCPGVAVLILTGFADGDRITAAIQSGALGYVPKQVTLDEVLRAIRCVAEGRVYLDRDAAREMFRPPRSQEPSAGALAGREVEILKLAAWGHANKEIANRLNLSVETVESCKSRSMEKLGLATRCDLVRYAVENGWLKSQVT